jgi:hypothetical protein
LTEDNTTEAVESQEESASGEDSPVIKQLRQQLKEAQRELKSVPNRSDVEAEIRAAVAREKAIESELVALSLPAGLSETVEGKLGDAEVTREKVVEALTSIGFQVTAEDDGGTQDEADSRQANDLAQVANLGNQVAQAATQQTQDNLTDKINEAETPEQLAAIMREAGLGS